MQSCFEHLGVRWRINEGPAELHKALQFDFQRYCIQETKPEKKEELIITCSKGPIDKNWRACWIGKRSTLYWAPKGERRVCFFGGAWTAYQYCSKGKTKALVYALNTELLIETCYLICVSFIGEKNDERGRHRIHALGAKIDANAFVFLAPSGGGKSTLGWRLKKTSNAQFLSDDTPLVGRQGKLFSFFDRFSFKTRPNQTPFRLFHRAEHGSRYLVPASHFEGRISEEGQAQFLLLLRKGQNDSKLRPISKVKLLWPLLKWLVIGWETPQIWELSFRFTPKRVLTSLSRLRAAGELLKGCEAFEFVQGFEGKVVVPLVQLSNRRSDCISSEFSCENHRNRYIREAFSGRAR